jgi:hypothetical protein
MIKKSIITVFVIIALYVVSSVALAYWSIPSPVWSDTDCGGVDPYHKIECRFVGAGYKQQCRLFVCTKEKVSVGLPIFNSTEDEQPPDDAGEDD